MSYRYRGYGLDLLSEIALPEFLPATGAPEPDIRIRCGVADEPCFRPEAAAEAVHYDFVPASGGGFVMIVPEVAVFHVREGREIAFVAEPDADPGILRLFLIGSAMGMALHQRGLLVMHGATVLAPDGTATIFVGDSGAGKSTLAAALGRAGYPILGDDTMPVTASRRGFEVWPGSRVFKLWGESLRHFGEGTDGLEQIRNRTEKFFWPNRAYAPDRPVPLVEVVLLDVAPDDAEPSLADLRGIEALRLVAENTYRPGYVRLLGRDGEHFRQCAALADAVRVGVLSRPRDLARLDEGVALLRARWAEIADDGAMRMPGAL